jgi:predicted hydrocarbon binding protein
MSFYNIWLNGFTDNLEKLAGKEKCEMVIRESKSSGKDGVAPLIKSLATHLDSETCAKTLQGCGRRCLSPIILKRAKTFMNASADLDLLLQQLNENQIGGGSLYREDSIIHAEYKKCYCPLLAASNETVSPVFCNCSTGWFKEFFETILEKQVEVELVQSIVWGSSNCKFRIHI